MPVLITSQKVIETEHHYEDRLNAKYIECLT